MRNSKLVVAACLAATSLIGIASPASASTCSGGDLDLSGACQVAAKVVCGVVAKGQPCLD